MIVFGGTLLAYLLSLWDLEPFKLTGEIAKGFPPVGLPPFSTEWNNETIGFVEMVKELGSAPFAIPLISILETVTIATIFCGELLLNFLLFYLLYSISPKVRCVV